MTRIGSGAAGRTVLVLLFLSEALKRAKPGHGATNVGVGALAETSCPMQLRWGRLTSLP